MSPEAILRSMVRLKFPGFDLADFEGEGAILGVHLIGVVPIFLAEAIRPLLELRPFDLGVHFEPRLPLPKLCPLDLSVHIKTGSFHLQIRLMSESFKVCGGI